MLQAQINFDETNTSTNILDVRTRLSTKAVFFLSALFFGALLPFAFAPFNFWSLAILSPTVLLLLWQDKNVDAKFAFWLGFAFGLGMYGFGVSWVFVSIHRYGGTDIPLAAFITLLLVTLMALFPAMQGYVLKRWFRGQKWQFLFIGFPSLWVLCEWVRSVLFTGFPWLFLGYSQLETPLKGFAPIGSVYLVSLAVLLSAASIVACIKMQAKAKLLAVLWLGLTWGGGEILTFIKWASPFSRIHTVSLVQGNVPLLEKFNQKDALKLTEERYGALSEPYLGQDLVLWPESAITVPIPYSNAYLEKLAAKAKKAGTTLISGIQTIIPNHQYHNSLIAVGNGHGIYHKHHLLPYGDYLPFESVLRGLISFFDLPMSSFIPGEAKQMLITAGDIKLNPQICYEIAFPELIQKTLREAEAIITLSEDGWFGDSLGPHQHLQIARMRALETARPVLRATTSGITAIIDHQGKLVASAPMFQATVLSGQFQPMQGNTLWVTIGIWPWLLCLLLAFLLPGRWPMTPITRGLINKPLSSKQKISNQEKSH